MAPLDNMSAVDLAVDAGDALGDFRALYREQHGMVWHALVRFGVSFDLVDDAVQDAFVTAYRRRHTFAHGSSRGAWMYGIARRIAANYRRAAARQARKHRAVRAEAIESAHPFPAQAALRTLTRFVAELDPDDREIFVLSELEGMSGPEVAAARGKNLHTTYSRIRKLRACFRRELGDDGDALIERGRGERPRATARGWAALAPLLGSVKPAVIAASTWTALLVGAAIGGAALVGVVSTASSIAPRPDVVPVAATEPVAAEAPRASERRENDESTKPAEPTASADATATASVDATATASVDTSATATATASHDATTPIPARRSGPRARATADAPALADDLRAQTELLQRASEQLAAADPDAALATLTQHADRFPGSALSDLRTAVRVEALCAAGQHTRARTEAAAFLAQRPGSPVARRIRETCTAASENPGSADKGGA